MIEFKKVRSSASEKQLCNFSIGKSCAVLLKYYEGRNQTLENFEKGSKMSVHSTNAPSFFGVIGAAIAAFFTNIIESSAMAQDAEARGAQIAALNAKTDVELAAMNLRRDEISGYVFRDLMYI